MNHDMLLYDEVASLKGGSHLVHCIFGEYMQAEIRRQSLLSIFLAFVVGLGLVPQAAATKKVCG